MPEEWLVRKIAEMNARIKAREEAEEVKRQQAVAKVLDLRRYHRERVAYVESLRRLKRGSPKLPTQAKRI